MRIRIDGTETAISVVEAGSSEVTATFARGKDEVFTLEIDFEAMQKWSPAGDDRDLALMVIDMRMEHPVEKARLFKW